MKRHPLTFVRRLTMSAALLGLLSGSMNAQSLNWPTHPDETERELEVRRALRRELQTLIPQESFDDLVNKRAKELAAPEIARQREEFERRMAERKAQADAVSYDLQRAAAAAAQRPSSGGKITGRGKTVVIAPEMNRGEPPAGMVWIFPERSAQPLALAPIETAEMTEEQGKAAAQASHKRAVEKYPFLANKADPRRVQFDAFLKQAWDAAHYEAMFSLRDWREYAADECAILYRWAQAETEPVALKKE